MSRLLGFAWIALLIGVGCAPTLSHPPAAIVAPSAIAYHVVIIGLDGCRADALRDHAGPVVRSLIESGTVCWRMQAVTPTVTQVNWSSVLTGATPEHHGIKEHPVEQADLAKRHVAVPTLFELVAATDREAMGYLGHWKLYPTETSVPHTKVVHSLYEANRIAPIASAEIGAAKPAFTFLYFGDLDGLGHRNGWMSEPYLAGLADIDAGVAKVLAALEQAGIRDRTIIILTSDHGGHGKSHGEGTAEDRTIPLVISGPGIRRGIVIERELSTCDTAPTVLRALGIKIPETMDGKPIDEAFAAP